MIDLAVPDEITRAAVNLVGRLYPEGYDAIAEEPEFDLYIRCRRVTEGDIPHAQWTAIHAVEGVAHGELSETQRNYMAAVMRAMAFEVAGSLLLSTDHEQAAIQEAVEAKRTLRVAMYHFYNGFRRLVARQGLEAASRNIGLKPRQGRHLLKAAGAPETTL